MFIYRINLIYLTYGNIWLILYAVWGLASTEVLWIMDRCSRWGKQEHDIFLGSHHFLLIMKHTPPPLVLPASAVLSIHKTEKLSDGITAVSGTEVVSLVSDKQRMLQSLMSRWKLILVLRLSILFSKGWTLVSRMLGRGGLWALFLSLLRIPARFPWRFLIRRLRGLFKWPLFSSTFRSISNGHDELEEKFPETG